MVNVLTNNVYAMKDLTEHHVKLLKKNVQMIVQLMYLMFQMENVINLQESANAEPNLEVRTVLNL